MTNSKPRQLILAIAITSLMLSTSLVFQGASATTAVGSIAQKSITLTAGADGRSFAQINDTYDYHAIQTVDYNHPVELIDSDYDHGSSVAQYSYAAGRSDVGPWQSSESAYDPDMFTDTGPLSPYVKVPHFLMSHNMTMDAVSPTITLSAKNITMSIGTATEFQLDSFNPVVSILRVTATEQNKVILLTGQTTGSAITFWIYNPNHVYQDGWTVDYSVVLGNPAGYFAFPFLANIAGDYVIYFEGTNAYVKLTPTVLEATSMQVGQFVSGEMKIPATTPSQLPIVSFDREPSQVVALTYSVSKGDEYAFSFSMIEQLSSLFGPLTSQAECWYFDVAMEQTGTPIQGFLLGTGPPINVPVIMKAPASGKLFIVLVANYPSSFLYSMGVETVTIPTAPLNQPFPVKLPTNPAGLGFQFYKFNLTAESMVRMNYTDYSVTLQSYIRKLTPSGVIYETTQQNLGATASWMKPERAEDNYDKILHLDPGMYMLYFYTPSTGRALIEINTYPIASYTYGSTFDVDVGGTKAYAVDITASQVFDYWAFNVSLVSPQKNASIFYQMSLFNDYNALLNNTRENGLGGHPGIGTKKLAGGWIGINPAGNPYHVGPTSIPKNFDGNKTYAACHFLSTYAGRYFLVLDLLNGYDTKTSGATGAANQWNVTKAPTMSMKIDLTPELASRMLEMTLAYTTELSIDSSSGTGSNSVTFGYTNLAGIGYIPMTLTPKVNTWTRISVSILNGTAINHELIYDRLRYYGVNTFDDGETLGLWPIYHEETNKYGFDNTTYVIEFCSITPTMLIQFFIDIPGLQNHTVVTFNVRHFDTPAFSGLAGMVGAPPGPPPAAAFPVEIVLIVAVVAVVALVVIYVIVRKRAK